MAPTLLLALLLSTNTIPLPFNDVGATSISNSQSTLVAWTNELGSNPVASRVFIRLMDSSFDRNAVSLGSGFAPHIAMNGNDGSYLVGWSARGTRFNAFQSDNAIVQLVSLEGLPGARKVLNHSVIGGVTSVGWYGSHWIVAYYFEQGTEIMSRVVFLDKTLNVTATIDTGKGPVALQNVGGGWWAFRTDQVSVTEAIELHGNGTTGERFTTGPIVGPLVVTTGSRVLVLVQSGDDLDAIPFDYRNGFGTQQPFLASALLLDIEPYYGVGSLLLLTRFGETQYDAAYVDPRGEIRSYGPLFFSSVPQYPYASLGMSPYGPLFFFSPALPGDWATGAIDLYAYRLNANSPLDPLSGERVSQVTAPNDRRRAARH